MMASLKVIDYIIVHELVVIPGNIKNIIEDKFNIGLPGFYYFLIREIRAIRSFF